MKYEFYNPVEEKGSCVERSLTKVYNEDYNKVKEELINISKKLNKEDYKDTEVFEKYLFDRGAKELGIQNILVKDLKLDKGKYIVFCYRDDWYHLLPIIDNVIYDKTNDCLELNVIKVYEVGSNYEKNSIK